MSRRLVAVALSTLLLTGGLSAPLVHAHLDDDHGDHHGGHRIHAHLDGHSSHAAAGRSGIHEHLRRGGPARAPRTLGGTTEQATRMDVFVAIAPVAPAVADLPLAAFALPCSPASVMRCQPEEVRSHGPPAGAPAEPRAPPAASLPN